MGIAQILGGGASNIGMGATKLAIGNKMQLKQQGKLQRQEIAGQKEMGEFNQGLAIDTWDKTNFEAQRKHMENAGLNIGLMYSGSGGGGGTTTQAGNVAGGQASGTMDTTGMGIDELVAVKQAQSNIELQEAQKRNVDADTFNKIDTSKNLRLDAEIKEFQMKLNEATDLDQIMAIQEGARQELIKADMLARESGTQDALQWETIHQAQQKTILAKLEVENMKANTKLTQVEMLETMKKIDKMVSEIKNMKDLTEIQKQDMLTKRMQEQFNTSTPEQIKQWTDIGVDILNIGK